MSGIDPRLLAVPKIDWEATLQAQIEVWKRRIGSDLHANRATIDFETRSPVNLKKHGAWIYARDPGTEIMCLAYKLPGQPTQLWHMEHEALLIGESDLPLDLFAFILAGGLVEAHNVFFERCVWTHIAVARRGWPMVSPGQWRCSAAKCSAHALPRALEMACMAMEVPIKKDMDGRRVMLKLSKPRKPRKAETDAWRQEHGDKPMPVLYHESEEDLRTLWAYCVTDVDAEHALSLAVPDLSWSELLVWQMDQDMNWAGAKFDRKLAVAALKLADKYKKRLNEELYMLTGIEAGTKRAQVSEWLASHEGLELPDTAKDTVDWHLSRDDLSGRARRILEILREVNKTSTRKYTAILNYADPDDDRIRDLLMYHGANTGRWAGKGVQVQNFPKGEFDDFDMDEACEWVLEGDIDWIEAMYGDVMAFLSATIRGTIIPSDGRDFMVADYSAIEARCVLWLAEAQAALDVFRRGEDIYCDMATGIYGHKVTKADKPKRQFGKQAVLGLGYGMGFITFLLTCRKYNISFTVEQVRGIMGTDLLEKHSEWIRKHLRLAPFARMPDGLTAEEQRQWRQGGKQAAMNRRRIMDAREDPAKIVHELALMRYTVGVYRNRYPEVKEMWTLQEQAAIKAVETGERVECGLVTWFMAESGKFLHCELPSGRLLSYCDPELKTIATPWGESRSALRYMRMGTNNKWERTATYGGKLVENITQAVARDIMAHAMVAAWQDSPYDTIASIHDELVCEVDQGVGNEKEFEALMSDIPGWATGCPITAEAERYRRYRK